MLAKPNSYFDRNSLELEQSSGVASLRSFGLWLNSEQKVRSARPFNGESKLPGVFKKSQVNTGYTMEGCKL